MDSSNYERIIELLKKEIVPALGCTEPIAVALAASKARDILNDTPEKIDIWVSSNIFKNGMGVGIPGTELIGLNIAAALGAIGGNSNAELEVLKDINHEHLKKAKEAVRMNKVKVEVKDVAEKLYIECVCRKGDNYSRVIIKNEHSNIVHIEYNNKKLFEKDKSKFLETNSNEEIELSINQIYEFTINSMYEDIMFMLDGVRLNKAIAKEGLKGDYGLQVGKKIAENVKKGILADDIMTHAMSLTAAASDARMDGCKLPVMSNSGSGNQGIVAYLPVVAVAEKIEANDEKLTRALILSNLIAIHIKRQLGRLSALCGCVVAATGASCGVTYLLGGKHENMIYSIKNMIGNISGIICDGAKTGCGLKVSTGVSAAIQSALLAIDGIEISENDGIIEKDIEKTIRNLTEIGTKGMLETDKLILDIMVCK